MVKVLWIAGMMFGPLWGADNLPNQANKEPVPVQPWVADPIPDRFENKNDHRVPIRGPIKPGEAPTCDAPDQGEILRAMPRVSRGIPYLYEEFRDDIEFTVEKMADRVDAPRFFPLIGQAQMHHCQWKCTVYYTETVDFSFPLPFRFKTKRAEVVYIDKDQLHLAGAQQDAQDQTFRDLMACPGGFAGKKETAKTERAVQVHLDVTIAQIDRMAMPALIYHRLQRQLGFTDEDATFSVVKNRTYVNDLMQALRREEFAQILCEPQIQTLNGRKASVVIGGEPILTSADVGKGVVKQIGMRVEVLPTVLANGKIRLEVRPEFTTHDGAQGFNTQSANVAVDMDADRTVILRGMTVQETTTIETRIPVLSDFPVLGRLFRWRDSQETQRERVIVVTPRLIEKWGDAEPSHAPPAPFPLPAELRSGPASVHRVKASDILHIEAKRLTPKGPHKLGPTDVLLVEILGTPTKHTIGGPYVISAEGTIDLSDNLRFIRVAGRTLAEAQAVIEKRVAANIWAPLAVNVTLDDFRGAQQIRGQHLVRPNGTINLGIYGFVHVEGMKVGEVKLVVEKHLEEYLIKPQVSVEVNAYDRGAVSNDADLNEEQLRKERRRFYDKIIGEPLPVLPVGAVEANRITDVLALWNKEVAFSNDNAKMPGLTGRLFLFAGDATADVNGEIIVVMNDRSAGIASAHITLAEWRFPADILKKLKRKDGFGDSYTLFLPLDPASAKAKQVQITVLYLVGKDFVRYSRPVNLTLQSDGATNDEAPLPKQPTAKHASKQMTLEEIVRLSKHAGTEDLIIRQIELTDSVFQPTTSEILSLLEQGVNPRVIRVMQERRASPPTALPGELRMNYAPPVPGVGVILAR